MNKVLLVNHSVGITTQTMAVVGHSRKTYGQSRYDNRFNAHVFEMSNEDYEKAANDLARNWHKSRCKWVPHFLETEKVVDVQTSPQLREIALGWASKLSKDDIAMLAEQQGLFAPAAQTITTGRVSGKSEPAEEWPKKWFGLLGLAKREGVNVTGLKTADAVKAAILAHRQQKAA